MIGFNHTARDNAVFDEIHSMTESEAVLPEADMIILTIGLSTDTKHILNAKRLKGLKSGAILINLVRGGLIDEEALLNVFPRLGGTMMYVFEQESLQTSNPLWYTENVILTPHNNFVGEKNVHLLARVMIENIKKTMSSGAK